MDTIKRRTRQTTDFNISRPGMRSQPKILALVQKPQLTTWHNGHTRELHINAKHLFLKCTQNIYEY